jgi:ABC-type Mn2+/Zn2+ transport system ATPase subunit
VSDPLVRLWDVDLGYGRRPVLRNVRLDVAEGSFLGIVGPNGGGKSTLLKGILGLLPPQRGRIVWREERRSMRFGYVPQRETVDAVFPITALEVALMGHTARSGWLTGARHEGRAEALRALAHVGIAELAGRRFRDLSGGQQQRVLIARALAASPRVLLLDEPTNGMDLGSEHALMELIAGLHREQRLTVVMVSHLLNVVINYVRELVLVGREAFISGPLDEVLTPENLGRVYGTGVTLQTVEGRRIVLPSGREAVTR